MPSDAAPAAPGSSPLLRPLDLYQINNSMHVTVPAVFGAVGAALGLAPVFWASSAMLAASGYAARPRKKA